MYVYLGTDGEAPLTKPWCEEAPAFHVTMISPEWMPFARTFLPHRNLLELCSYQGCGCGFRTNEKTEPREAPLARDNWEDWDPWKSDADHDALARYLEALPLSPTPSKSSQHGWEGPVSDIFRRDVRISDLADRNFWFCRYELITLVR